MRFYGYRFYSPELGRWPNRDPIEEMGGMNLFGMTKNNLIQFYDLLGLMERGGVIGLEPGDATLPPEYSEERKGGVKIAYFFTCKCGWIDGSHVDSWYNKTDAIIKAFDSGKSITSSLEYLGPLGGKHDFDYTFQRPPAWGTTGNDDFAALISVVTQGMYEEEKRSQSSRFGFEDLNSNAIGAYLANLARTKYGGGVPPGNAFNDLFIQILRECGVVSKQEALTVWDDNDGDKFGQTIGFKQRKMSKCSPCKNYPNGASPPWYKKIEDGGYVPPPPYRGPWEGGHPGL